MQIGRIGMRLPDYTNAASVLMSLKRYQTGFLPSSFLGTTIIEYKNGSVEITKILPSIGVANFNITKFNAEFDKLIQFDPIRYLKLMIQQYDEIIGFIEDCIIDPEEYELKLAT